MALPGVQMDYLGGFHPGQVQPVAVVSPLCKWMQGICVAGTSNWFNGSTTIALTAAAETLTADEIYAADLVTAGAKCIIVPPSSMYMRIGVWGDNSSIATAPIVQLWGTHGRPNNGRNASVDLWEPLANVLGATSLTFSGTPTDTANNTATSATGLSILNRYVIPPVTYRESIFDLQSAGVVVVKVTTIGTNGNFNLWHRFM